MPNPSEPRRPRRTRRPSYRELYERCEARGVVGIEFRSPSRKELEALLELS